MPQHDFCSYCGGPFATRDPRMRMCDRCGATTYINPTPVAVVLLPVDDGLLVVRRAIEPKIGELTFPGGYVHADESWQTGAARELFEETRIALVDPATIEVFDVLSTRRGHLVTIYGLAPRLRASDLPPFTPTDEASELAIIREPLEMAFPQDTLMARKFFERRT